MSWGSSEDKAQPGFRTLDGVRRAELFFFLLLLAKRSPNIFPPRGRKNPEGRGREGGRRKRPVACCWSLHVQTLFGELEEEKYACNALKRVEFTRNGR